LIKVDRLRSGVRVTASFQIFALTSTARGECPKWIGKFVWRKCLGGNVRWGGGYTEKLHPLLTTTSFTRHLYTHAINEDRVTRCVRRTLTRNELTHLVNVFFCTASCWSAGYTHARTNALFLCRTSRVRPPNSGRNVVAM